ncbi:carotenoid 1,2-hydratase [Methylobacterium sp. Leaf118]|uniref:carotenoid 1,2-hydratase n=1 Tax=Methylobacterium sp. Leaf118 TaxID=2876562 RepID=UPI001E48E635|nr:carotenoid 1,2-hydratase [Methylobacterium sp. Leaf118]
MARGGYVWWYVDALSADGTHGLTIIAFIGSVFSPYYVWDAGQDPFNHCAVNVVLYGPRARFAMTERNARALSRDATSLALGPSSLDWDGSVLTIRLDERSAPVPRALRGTVRVRPRALTAQPFTLDSHGLHRWWPMAPHCDVEATFADPDLAWRGSGYLDTNDGDGRLEDSFSDWTWCRASLTRGSAILYDVRRRDGSGQNLTLRFDADGTHREMRPPLAASLPPTGLWRMPRTTRSNDGQAQVVKTFEDTPFYARSLLASTLDGEAVRPVHESLSLDRFRNPLVRLMLPFRMPRRI